MKIQVNGKIQEIEQETVPVLTLLELLHIESPDMVSVQLNGNIIQRQDYEKDSVKNGDKVEFLYFMGGGSQKGAAHGAQ